MKPVYISEWVSSGVQESRLGSHIWSVARLIELSREFESFDLPLIHLTINYYISENKLTLRKMAAHVKAVNEADLSYPIILDEDGEIMDGRHRVVKALILGKTHIKAVRFDKNPAPCRIEE